MESNPSSSSASSFLTCGGGSASVTSSEDPMADGVFDSNGNLNIAVGYDSTYSHPINNYRSGRHWQSRYEVSERLHGVLLDESVPGRSFCASRLHANGTCSCELSLMAEMSSIHATILRIIMLTEALNEVLDEIRRIPLSLSQSVLSLPAPENVVNSFPLKSHKSETTRSRAQDAQECYICLAEYDEGDQIRVLPCCHEFHMECVDKWLKEKRSVCPLCRGDVCKGIAEGS